MDRAIGLNDYLIQRALHGNPGIVNFKTAYKIFFDQPNLETWSQAYAPRVVSVAMNVPPAHLPGLGAVQLDTFIVNSKTRIPGDSHWKTAHYDQDDWEDVLGNATVLSYGDLINLLGRR